MDDRHCLYASQSSPGTASGAPVDGTQVDTLIVGGGYTGLSTALHLAERGQRVALLEAREPGWGAAGRNGGQVNAGFKQEPDQLLKDFGPKYGPRLLRLGLHGPDRLFGLLERLRIDCDAVRCGTLRTAHSPAAAAALQGAAAQWNRHGAPVEIWNAARVMQETGTARYTTGLYDPRGGAVNPLGLARGLATAAQRAGAAIHAGTPVLDIARHNNRWHVRTPTATLQANLVVITTQAYSTDLWPGVRKTFVPAYSSIVATEPLPTDIARSVLPGKQVVYENGRITVYFRRDSQHRLLMGGRGVQREASGPGDFRHLVHYARRLWPVLRDVRWTHWWNGQLALTPDFYPKLHVPAAGLFIMVGFARGIAPGVAFGAELAKLADDGALDAFPLPVSALRTIPLHRFWKVAVLLRSLQGRVLDRLGY